MRTAPLAILALFALTSTAFAEPVTFASMADDAAEAEVIRSFVPGVTGLQSAVVDLNKDGTAELFVRDPASCDPAVAEACRTLVLRYRSKDWRIVFDTNAASVEVGEVGYGGMANLTVDGVDWSWSTASGYRVDVAASGEPVTFALASADYVELLAEQFGDGALALFRAQQSVKVNIAQVKLNEGGDQAVMVRMEGPGVCGVVYGCPWRLLQVKDGAYSTLLEGTGAGAVSIMPLTRSGWNDIGAELPGQGFVTYGWNGEAYAVSQLVKGSL